MSASPQKVKPASGVTSRVLVVIGLLAALTYIIGLWAKFPNAVQLIAKAIPLLCMLAWLWVLPRDRFANTIMAGLAVSLLADLVMQWDKSMFLPGLVIFLVAQIIYISAFVGVTRRGSWVRLLPFAAWGLIAFLLLTPYLTDLLLPVAIYIVAISSMMWRAAATVGAQGKTRDFELAALLGAISFGLSDTLLAFNRFIWHNTLTMFSVQDAAPFIATLIMILYWLGQCGLALAAGWEAKDRARGKLTEQRTGNG